MMALDVGRSINFTIWDSCVTAQHWASSGPNAQIGRPHKTRMQSVELLCAD